MNNVSIIGRLSADPELKHTQSGTAVTRFNIAVDRRVKAGEERQADFINITAWSKTAEFICKYFSKGQRIALTGSIRTGSYTAQDGTKRYTTEVWAENVEFCESKSSTGDSTHNQPTNNYSTNQASKPYSNGSASDFTDMPSDDDLPF